MGLSKRLLTRLHLTIRFDNKLYFCFFINTSKRAIDA